MGAITKLGVLALLTFAAAACVEEPVLDSATSALGVDVCHVDDEGAYRVITVGANAAEAHLAHHADFLWDAQLYDRECQPLCTSPECGGVRPGPPAG